jgi:hypothetical protein
MMESTFKLEDVGKIKALMTVTMSLSDWQRLREQIASTYPSWEFANAIDRLVKHATARYSQQADGEIKTA